MIENIALCADTTSLMHPEILGLEDVSLDSLAWLHAFSQGNELRTVVTTERQPREVWILSADDIEPINLAAALRHDGYKGSISLVMEQANGSSLSRSSAAGVSEVLTPEAFIRRFSLEARRHQRMHEASASLSFASLGSQPPKREIPEVIPIAVRDVPPRRAHGSGPSRSSAQASNALKSGNPRKASDLIQDQVAVPVPQGSGSIVVILSGSGGVGKSTIAATLAAIAAQKGRRTLAIDGDLQFGCLGKHFEGAPRSPLLDAVADDSNLKGLATTCTGELPALITAPERPEQSEGLGSAVSTLTAASTELFDLVIVDTGSHWSDMHASLMEMASWSLFVMDQRMSSVQTCQRALELCKRLGLAQGSFAFALNHCSKEAPFTGTDLSYALNGAPVHEINDGGLDVEDLCSSSLTSSLAHSNNPFARSLAAMASKLLPDLFGEPEASATERTVLTPLLHSFRSRRRERNRGRKRGEITVRTGAPSPEFHSTQHAWEALS